MEYRHISISDNIRRLGEMIRVTPNNDPGVTEACKNMLREVIDLDTEIAQDLAARKDFKVPASVDPDDDFRAAKALFLDNSRKIDGVKGKHVDVLQSVLDEFEKPEVNSDEEADEDATQSMIKYVNKCPLTKKRIDYPVRNNVCKHVYEKSTILEYLGQTNRRKCPVDNCTNSKEFSANDLRDFPKFFELCERKVEALDIS